MLCRCSIVKKFRITEGKECPPDSRPESTCVEFLVVTVQLLSRLRCALVTRTGVDVKLSSPSVDPIGPLERISLLTRSVSAPLPFSVPIPGLPSCLQPFRNELPTAFHSDKQTLDQNRSVRFALQITYNVGTNRTPRNVGKGSKPGTEQGNMRRHNGH